MNLLGTSLTAHRPRLHPTGHGRRVSFQSLFGTTKGFGTYDLPASGQAGRAEDRFTERDSSAPFDARLSRENGKLNPVAVMGHARGGSAQSAALEWLEDGRHPLDWNGPTSRIFTRFRDEDMDRPIVDRFERVARRDPNRIAVTDSNTSPSYGELWGGPPGLAQTIAAANKPPRPLG